MHERYFGNPIHYPSTLKPERREDAMASMLERFRKYNIRWGFVFGGGGARFPGIQGVLGAFAENGAIGQTPYAAFGTSSGGIITAELHLVDITQKDQWDAVSAQIAEMNGFLGPWRELTNSGDLPYGFRSLAFEEYYENCIAPYTNRRLPSIPAAPAVTGIIATQLKGFQPYIFHNDCWEDQNGMLDIPNLLQSVAYSSTIPALISTEPHPKLGRMIDGWLNRYDLRCPDQIADDLFLQEHGGLLVSVLPVGDRAPGVYHRVLSRGDKTLDKVEIILESKKPLYKRVRNMYRFRPGIYEEGREKGLRALDLISELNLTQSVF